MGFWQLPGQSSLHPESLSFTFPWPSSAVCWLLRVSSSAELLGTLHLGRGLCRPSAHSAHHTTANTLWGLFPLCDSRDWELEVVSLASAPEQSTCKVPGPELGEVHTVSSGFSVALTPLPGDKHRAGVCCGDAQGPSPSVHGSLVCRGGGVVSLLHKAHQPDGQCFR